MYSSSRSLSNSLSGAASSDANARRNAFKVMSDNETSYANLGTSNANTRGSLNGSFATNRWNDQDERENNNSRQPQRGRGRGRGRGGGNRQQDGNRGASYGIGYQKIKELCKDMDEQKLLPADLLIAVQVQSFYNRLDDLWPEAEKQSNFLRVIVETASANLADRLHLTHAFVEKVLESKLLEIIVDCICLLAFSKKMQQEPFYADIAHHTVKLMKIGLDLCPSKMDVHLKKVDNVVTNLKKVKENFLSEAAKIQLESLEISLKNSYEAKAAQRDTKEIQKKQIQPFEGSPGEPPTNFRQMSIVPTPEDIFQKSPPYLRAMKIKGKFESDEQYLDINFRLVCEDSIRSLRDGITAYRTGVKNQNSLFIYTDVEIGASTIHKQTGELISYAVINVSKRMRLDKQLKYGSLVCLSSDDFQNVFLFATLLDRKDLPNGKIGLKFEEVSKINTKLKYKMVESPAFFEAYRHVMTALQAFKVGEPVPFSKYLVNVETDTVAPLYTIDQLFDFKSLLDSEETHTEYYLHQLNGLEPKDFNMDDSQFDALIYVLSTQLAILQGPPGTGKTYMGLQIAKLLLDNWNVCNPDPQDSRPILVVCYTNHALDQFLEGISKFLREGIIRVGGRCKNEAIENFNLSEIRYNLLRNLEMENYNMLQSQFRGMRYETQRLQDSLQDSTEALKELKARFVHPYLLDTALCDSEKRYIDHALKLRDPYCPSSDSLTLMSKWLTQTDESNQIKIDDIQIIRQLMAWGVPEIQAKNALADARKKCDFPDVFQIAAVLKSKRCQISSTKLVPSAENRLKIDDIDRVKEMGFAEIVAAEMLIQSNVEQIREEYNGRIKPKSQPTALTVTADAKKKEELDEFAFKDDDEENRIINDVHVLKDVQNRNKNIAKYKFKWYDEKMNDYSEHITSARPMSEEEANQVEDIWELPLQQRWRLYQYWIKKCRKNVKEKVKKLEEDYCESVKKKTELQTLVDVDILKDAKVIGMTTTGAARHQSTLRALRPRIVIVEEAAEVLEAHLLTSLTPDCQHCILIGDHKQLRPNPAVYELAKKYNLEVSLFERLTNNAYPYRMLQNQHRMCTDISQVLMPHFYEDLRDAPSVSEKESVKGVTKNLMFINHGYPEQTEKEFKSHKNEYEAEFAIRLANYFVQQDYKENKITILCTYLDQLLVLRRKAVARFGKNHAFVIQSVDNYQGEENDIVILSLVRSNNPENKIGFLKIPNRVCVALSRAKLGLYVICNMDFLAANSDLWDQIRQTSAAVGALSNELVVSCQMHGNEQAIKHYIDFDNKCSEGGCNAFCESRLECGHTCNKRCHGKDMNHQLQKCYQPCDRKCNSEFKHPCEKDCWQPCGYCHVVVLKRLLCGHEKFDFCYLNPADIQCDQVCYKPLPCGHQCNGWCGAECTKHCKEKVQRRLPGCGHTVTVDCCQNLNDFKCRTKVSKKWPFCNHTAETECSSDVSTLPCPHPCNTVLPDCQHLCKGRCGSCRNGRLHIACTENCNKIFLCEHQCETKCSKICPPCDKPCETACGHNQCGNQPIHGEQLKKTRKLLERKRGSRTGRKCGEPCPPCMEDCLNRCEHRECSNKCGEPCDVEPCNEPCTKLLSCNVDHGYYVYEKHQCIGVCGENCPKICKICKPEEFAKLKEVFLGYEEDENARFVELKDCGHIIEVKGLDEWIETSIKKNKNENGSTEIVQIKCPLCKTPIRRSKRYISILNERAIDIEQIKQKTRGLTNAEKKREEIIFKKEVKDIFTAFHDTNVGFSNKSKELEKTFNEANSNVLTKNWFSTSRNILQIIRTLTNYVKTNAQSVRKFNNSKIQFSKNMKNFEAKLGEFTSKTFWRFLHDECDNLIQRINPSEISEFMLQQISFEVQRFAFILDLFAYFSEAINCNVDFKPAEIQMITTIFEDLNGSKEFDDAFAKEISGKLQNLAKSHPVSNFGVSQKERIDIIRAVGSHITHWYKCPNGHHYGISGCGEAVTKSKCPECQAEIGGESHRLLPTNQDAQDEMYEGTGITARRRNPFVARRF